MQRPDQETGYRYALPAVDGRLGVRVNVLPDQFLRWAREHAKHRPVSRQTDTLTVRASRLRQESRELGHVAVAIAHETGQDQLFEAYASRALRAKQLRRVLEKWKLLRSKLDAVIPLDDVIAEHAVDLANRFIESGQHVKGSARNTMNDMYVAATSLSTGIPLVTDDAQLRAFYNELGWTVTVNDDLYIASPDPRPAPERPYVDTGQRGDRYVNRPPNLRAHSDQTPPPSR